MKRLFSLALIVVLGICLIDCGQKSHKKTQTDSRIPLKVSAPTTATNSEPEFIKDWDELKPVYERSIATMVRTSAGGWPENYLDQVSSINEKGEIIRPWLLAVDGSYSDCIITGLGEYMDLFDKEITKAPTNSRRSFLFKIEIKGLIEILYTLDKQIAKYIEFSDQANTDFNEFLTKYLGRTPADSDKVNNGYWELFIENNHKYSRPWPGFFSTQVGWQKDDRSYENYHANERALLSSMEIPKELSLGVYKEYMKKIGQSRLGWCLAYKL